MHQAIEYIEKSEFYFNYKKFYVTYVDHPFDYKMRYTKYMSMTAHFLSQGRPYKITNKWRNLQLNNN